MLRRRVGHHHHLVDVSPRHVDDIREQIPDPGQAGPPAPKTAPPKFPSSFESFSRSQCPRYCHLHASIPQQPTLLRYRPPPTHPRDLTDPSETPRVAPINLYQPHKPPTPAQCPSTHPPTRSPCCASTAGDGTSFAGATPRSARRPRPTGPATSRWATPRSCASSRVPLTSNPHGAQEAEEVVVDSGPNRTRRPRWP